ncbi:pyridoxal phosphate-dependent transferase [Biscogniauxia marginata]|nr:pyridoxal phosphate-dependent transferase [Biscogniauxia marginata]
MSSTGQPPLPTGENQSSVNVTDDKISIFGPRMLQHFDFEPTYRNLNHGSFGAAPREVRNYLRQYQDLTEAKPDSFIRYDSPSILDESREAVAKLLNAPTDAVVFVSNATTGVNTIFRNMVWNEDGNDVILYFGTIYGACGKTIDYVVDTGLGRVSSREIPIRYPCEDADIVNGFKSAVKGCANEGKRARICIFDTVSSLPGVRFPFEEMTRACQEAGVLSLIDGAQGIGMIDIDLRGLNPDFFVSNCHKWLHVPRGCAVLYVPFRNQEMITSTLPTSHGYISKSKQRVNPLPESSKSAFVNNFEFVGTVDNSPFLCVKNAIQWRKEVLGGEARISEYIIALAKEGGKEVARILGTEVLDNKTGTMSNCSMTNIALPLSITEASAATEWILKTMMKDYKTFLPLFIIEDRFWVRISAQVYLDIDDFKWAGHTLLELCTRVKKGEHQSERVDPHA